MKKKILVISLAVLLIFGLLPAKFLYSQEGPEKQIIESLEFREVDIKDILRQLAKQYNLNIVFSDTVKGLVTVQLNNVTVSQALDSIITVNGFSYTKKENVYKVATQEEAQREGKQTKLFKLNNANALRLKDTLAKVLTSEGSIEADSRSNSILVTDSLTAINKVEQMMPVLDEITPQVLIEARLIETSLTNEIGRAHV
jgi:type IV pilus assembly protein PilQ